MAKVGCTPLELIALFLCLSAALLFSSSSLGSILESRLDNQAADQNQLLERIFPLHDQVEELPSIQVLKRYTWKLFRNESERHDCSNLPFQHCCVGQCRQSAFKIRKGMSLWKLTGPSRSLANLTDVLKYYDGISKQSGQPCTIIFAGDSLSSDHAMAANCELLNSGYELISCSTKRLGGAQYGNDTSVRCKTNVHHFTHFLLQNNATNFCKTVLIAFSGLRSSLLKSIISSLNENTGLVVFNWGVHCNDNQSGCITSMLSSEILPLVSEFGDAEHAKWRFLFRETEPQHFKTDDGNFDGGHVCAPAKSSENKVESSNWRNKEAERFLSTRNLTGRIKTVRLHDALVPLWQLHHPMDCTHYCYDPYRFDVTWDGLLNAIST